MYANSFTFFARKPFQWKCDLVYVNKVSAELPSDNTGPE